MKENAVLSLLCVDAVLPEIWRTVARNGSATVSKWAFCSLVFIWGVCTCVYASVLVPESKSCPHPGFAKSEACGCEIYIV